MMRPARARIIAGKACWMHRCAPVRFVRITASQSSAFMRIASPSRVIAALFTKMSSRPNFSSTCLNPALTCSASATSIFTANASPPAAKISFTNDASFSSFRAATATFAPASASARAVSRPIPCEAPVTSATLSFKLNIRDLAHCPRSGDFSLSPYLLTSLLPYLVFSGRVGTRPGNLLRRGRQAPFVFDVQRRHRPLDLPQQSREHAPRPNFHKRIHPFFDQQTDRLFPPHRHGYLLNQRFARFTATGGRVRIHIRHQRHL